MSNTKKNESETFFPPYSFPFVIDCSHSGKESIASTAEEPPQLVEWSPHGAASCHTPLHNVPSPSTQCLWKQHQNISIQPQNEGEV